MKILADNTTRLKKLLKLGNDLNKIHDPDAVMERILCEAREFCNADAGSIYIVKDNTLIISYVQNNTLKQNTVMYKQKPIRIDSSSIAGYCAKTGHTLLLNDVQHIEKSKPYSFNSYFDKKTGYNTTAILTIPMKGDKNQVIGVLQIINPINEKNQHSIFQPEDIETIKHFAGIASVALEKARLTRSILLKMIQMAQLHDPSETGLHVKRVSAYSTELYVSWAVKNKIPASVIDKNKDILKLASMVHDIGKVAISDLILKKPGPLTDEEFEEMKKHTVYGAAIFEDQDSEFEKAAAEVALNHHERWDGTGYPGVVHQKGNTTTIIPKKDKEIPLFGRIVTIADIFDALSSKRCYKDAWDEKEVESFLRDNSGKIFDPELTELFIKRIELMNSIREKYQ